MQSTIPPGGKAKAKVKQACDCCHVRKIRCDGANPCGNCTVTDLQCTYLAVPKKKGPKGRRLPKLNQPDGKPSSPVKKPPRAATEAEHRSRPPTTMLKGFSGPPTLPFQLALPALQASQRSLEKDTGSDDFNGLSTSPILTSSVNDLSASMGFQRSRLVSDDLIKACVNAFFTHKYPIMPIMDSAETYALLSDLDGSPENYSLIIALCAVIVMQRDILDPAYLDSGIELPSPEFLIKEATRARSFCDHVENPSLAHVQTSFFFFAALFGLGRDNSAWFYIRESMTMLQLQRLHEESTYTSMENPLCKIYCRRTFWLLFITERAYALQRHRPLTLQRTIDLPTVDAGPEATILSGFLDLVSLFQNFDDTFLSLWNLSGTESAASPQSLVQLQDILKFAIPNVSERTEIQQADLLVSRQWLKTMVWQLCVTKGLLSSASADESMSFHYPVHIARDMVGVSRLLPTKAFEANGVGILEKIFDIGCSLSDVLQFHPSFKQASGLEIGPRDYLVEIVRILGSAPGGNKYLRLLTEKADECLRIGIKGSLSGSDTSEKVEEIGNEDEMDLECVDNENPEYDGDVYPHTDQMDPGFSFSGFEIGESVYSDFDPQHVSPESDTTYQPPFSMTMPELSFFMKPRMIAFDGS